MRTVGAFLVAVLVVLTGSGSALSPIQPAEGFGLQHVALHALEASLRSGDLYAETTQKDRFFTKDQMMGILAALGAQASRPDQAAFWQDRAANLWRASEAAFVEDTFYAGTLPAATGVVCIDVEANSWALRAAHALSQTGATLVPNPAERVKQLRTLLGSFLTGTTSAGRPLCPSETGQVPLHLRPHLFLSLLETRNGLTELDGNFRSALDSTITTWFEDAFALTEGLYLASLNAQMLAVLVEASRIYDVERFRTSRDDLARWIQFDSIQTDRNGTHVTNMQRVEEEFEVQSAAGPDGQIWAAYALANAARDNPNLVDQSLVDDLLRSFGSNFWLADASGFAGGTIVYAEYNLLPAILGRAFPFSLTALDPATLGFVVLSRPSFAYPGPESANAGNIYIVNEWSARFTLPGDPTAAVDVVVPAQGIAPFNFSLAPSSFFPAPVIVRTGAGGGTELSVRDFDNDPNLIHIGPETRAAGTFRLDGYVPARPVFSDFGSSIRLVFENGARQPVVLGTLQLELQATELRIRSATLDNVEVADLEVIDPVITEQLPEPHMRLLLTDVSLPTGRSELVLSYSDIMRPEVGRPSITRDLDGRDVIRSTGDGPIQVLQGETAFVRATVRDNGALRSVQLRYRTLEQSLDLRMSPVEGQADVYAVQLPMTGIPTGEGIIQVVAIDAAGTGNLNESVPVKIDLRDPLFAGSIVLFVFSGTLFLAAFIIWLKVRRKELH